MKLHFERDVKAIEDGEWVELDELQPGLRVLLRGHDSEEVVAYVRERSLQVLADEEDEQAQARARGELGREALANVGIVAIEGLMDLEAGKPIDLSKEELLRPMALTLMTDKRYAAFATQITLKSVAIGRDRRSFEEKLRGNSGAPSKADSKGRSSRRTN